MLRVGALLFVGVLVVPGVARAGCPNVCEIGEASLTLEPELPCANVSANSDDCDCGITLRVGNRCELPLDALSFEFRSCGPSSGPFTHGCSEVAPEEQGTLEQPIHELGLNEFRFTLRHDGADHVITVAADVSSFDDGAICSVSRGAGRGGGTGWGALVAAMATVAFWRRTRRG